MRRGGAYWTYIDTVCLFRNRRGRKGRRVVFRQLHNQAGISFRHISRVSYIPLLKQLKCSGDKAMAPTWGRAAILAHKRERLRTEREQRPDRMSYQDALDELAPRLEQLHEEHSRAEKRDGEMGVADEALRAAPQNTQIMRNLKQTIEQVCHEAGLGADDIPKGLSKTLAKRLAGKLANSIENRVLRLKGQQLERKYGEVSLVHDWQDLLKSFTENQRTALRKIDQRIGLKMECQFVHGHFQGSAMQTLNFLLDLVKEHGPQLSWMTHLEPVLMAWQAREKTPLAQAVISGEMDTRAREVASKSKENFTPPS